MHRAGALLRTVLALGALLAVAACAQVKTSSRSQPAPFTFTGLAGEPDSLNPLLSNLADVHSLSHLYMSYLLDTDDQGRLIPEIAERIPTQANGDISRDGKTIVYHLRHGVRWQDGRMLTARDVVFSYRAVMNPAVNVFSRVGYAEVASISAQGDDSVVVRLRRPFSPFTAYFFGPQGNPALLPAHLLEHVTDLNRAAYNSAPVGSGPFRVVKWDRGESISFAANPLYWRGRPRIARMLYRVVPDPNTRLQLLQTGEVDAYFDVDPQLLPQLRSLGGVTTTLTPVDDIHFVQFNARDPLVSDVRIRRAIALGINRRRLIAAATHGSGILVDADQPRNGWAYDLTVPSLKFDPAAARRLLAQAGWMPGPGGVRAKGGTPLDLTLTIAPAAVNGSAQVATLLQDDLHSLGIALTIKPVPAGLLYTTAAAGGILRGGKYQIVYSAWWTLGPDPDDTLRFGCDQFPPRGNNLWFWCDRQADAAMYAGLASVDQARRRADYAVVQRAIVRDLPFFALWQVRMPDAYRSRLRGISPSPFGSVFWNAWRWTLAS